METRIRILLLASVLTLTSGCATMHRLWPWHRQVDAEVAAQKADADADAAAAAADTAAPPTVIEPQVVRRKIKVPKITAKDVELGASYRRDLDRELHGRAGMGRHRRLPHYGRFLLRGRRRPGPRPDRPALKRSAAIFSC